MLMTEIELQDGVIRFHPMQLGAGLIGIHHQRRQPERSPGEECCDLMRPQPHAPGGLTTIRSGAPEPLRTRPGIATGCYVCTRPSCARTRARCQAWNS